MELIAFASPGHWLSSGLAEFLLLYHLTSFFAKLFIAVINTAAHVFSVSPCPSNKQLLRADNWKAAYKQSVLLRGSPHQEEAAGNADEEGKLHGMGKVFSGLCPCR